MYLGQVLSFATVQPPLYSLGPWLSVIHLTADLPSLHQLSPKILTKRILPSCNIQQLAQYLCSLIPRDFYLVRQFIICLSGRI